MSAQLALDFNPAPARTPVPDLRVLEVERARRDRHRDLILSLLRGGPRTNVDLLEVTHRFSGRIHELRRAGWSVETKALGGGLFLYTLLNPKE